MIAETVMWWWWWWWWQHHFQYAALLKPQYIVKFLKKQGPRKSNHLRSYWTGNQMLNDANHTEAKSYYYHRTHLILLIKLM